jgi:hypothetical protein
MTAPGSTLPHPKKRGGILARLHPVGTIFLSWVVLDEIADSGRRLAPKVIGTAWFQRSAGLVLAVVLAIGFLVALRHALIATGRGRLVNASLALVFAAICSSSAVFHIWLADMTWQQTVHVQAAAETGKSRLPQLLDKAWNGQKAEGRLVVARTTYRLFGLRIGYRDEAGAGRFFEPPPDMVTKDEQRRRATDSIRWTTDFMAEQAAHSVRVAYAYLFGVGVMLVGSLVIAVRAQITRLRGAHACSGDPGGEAR